MSAPPCAAPDANPRPPVLPAPPGTCECHSHVFGPAERFPFAADRSYTPPDAPLESYLALHDALGIERGVVVQGSAHGTDNAAVLHALDGEPERLRGVVVVDGETTAAQLKRMDQRGVRGARFNHMFKGGKRTHKGVIGIEDFEKLHDTLADLGWHMQLWVGTPELPDLWPRLEKAKMPIVIDHMGRIEADQGLSYPGFDFLTRLLGEGKVWVKLSGNYRATDNWPDYGEARPFHEALVAANPDQCVWGLDWPHPSLKATMPNDGLLFDLFNTWTPDAENRRRILVDNPARLYGF